MNLDAGFPNGDSSSAENARSARLHPNTRGLWIARALGAVLTAGVGLGLFWSDLGDGLTHFSYDAPFALQPVFRPQEVVLVYLDEASHKILDQPLNAPWSRALHAQFLERMAAENAKAVVFDIVFSDPGPDPAADERLRNAIKAHGSVILSADLVLTQDAQRRSMRALVPPLASFRDAAAGWGVAQLPADSDSFIRKHFPATEATPSVAWAVARLAGAEVAQASAQPSPERWLGFYGPTGTIPGLSYHQALLADSVVPGFFSNKVVFVGQRLSTGFSGELKDEFGTAYTRRTKTFSPGVEIHATAFLNLLRRDWLVRVPMGLELPLLILIGIGAGIGLTAVSPGRATVLACLGCALVVAAGWLLFRYQRVWFVWLTVLVQLGVALGWSVLFNSVKLYGDKRVLRQSLEFHLSPSRVDQLLKHPELLKPGGREQQISILFSDIADFSKIAQTLDPEDLFDLLNNYYDAALKSIHDRDGTIVQLIGDAILAVWNAPVEQADHRSQACLAAVELNRRLITFDANQARLPMRTRVGIHTGKATVGNLGSHKRFDFATIGESVNLASRLEGLNKHLHTEVLATRAIQKSVDGQVLSRLVGYFKFKGFGQPVEVHELLEPMVPKRAEATQAWRDAFAEGLKLFHRRQFVMAEPKFRQTIQSRSEAERDAGADGTFFEEDGPSRFYLDRIEEFKKAPPPEHWQGEIELTEK